MTEKDRCYICWEKDGNLIYPCDCKVIAHYECIMKQINHDIIVCGLCNKKFDLYISHEYKCCKCNMNEIYTKFIIYAKFIITVFMRCLYFIFLISTLVSTMMFSMMILNPYIDLSNFIGSPIFIIYLMETVFLIIPSILLVCYIKNTDINQFIDNVIKFKFILITIYALSLYPIIFIIYTHLIYFTGYIAFYIKSHIILDGIIDNLETYNIFFAGLVLHIYYICLICLILLVMFVSQIDENNYEIFQRKPMSILYIILMIQSIGISIILVNIDYSTAPFHFFFMLLVVIYCSYGLEEKTNNFMLYYTIFVIFSFFTYTTCKLCISINYV